ncbi:uncharacterized protein LOC133793678 [Humulus lupulus]|uniref:uncharacterized protein LOC133793678 n=1 Tax=Humulus lupulus TaxID=3486 RepID=UPI002B411D60|nr:uncharacterized protein LOC133793678 [Humulus lupulus]
MAKLERWYFRSLRPEAHVDMKIIDAFAHVQRFTHKEKCDKMEDMRTLILPTFHPNLESGHGQNFWETGDFGFLGVPVDVTLVLNNAEKILVPMKDIEYNHWILAVLDIKSSSASYWDSMSTARAKRHRIHMLSTLLKKLDKLLLRTTDDVHSGRPVFEVFNIVPAGKLPQ